MHAREGACAPVDAVELLAGLADGGRVHDGRQVSQVLYQHIVQQAHVRGRNLHAHSHRVRALKRGWRRHPIGALGALPQDMHDTDRFRPSHCLAEGSL